MTLHCMPDIPPRNRCPQRKDCIQCICIEVVMVGSPRWTGRAAVFHSSVAVCTMPASVDQHRFFGHTFWRSEEHTSELQSRENLVCRLLLEKKNVARKDS